MASINIEQVKFIVPITERSHALYMSDGRIITIAVSDGALVSTAHLPNDDGSGDSGEKAGGNFRPVY